MFPDNLHMHPLSSFNRSTIIKKALAFEYDLLVIGGGITGAGIALDAVSRGLKVLVLEKQDFAAGTSSRSTKLIHGGLRYLKQFELGLVREVGMERAVLYKNAPHLVVPEKMLLPIVKGGTYGNWLTSFGLWLYDFLADVRPFERKRMLSKSEVMMREPLLRKDILLGGGLYTEYRTDDARLTIEVLKTAALKGADCLNYVEVVSFVYAENTLKGVTCFDREAKQEYCFNAKQIVNAAGPWVDQLREKDRSLNDKQLHLTKGVHLVVSHERFPVNEALYFDTEDKRMIFAIPVGNKTYFGTTDTNYKNGIENPDVNLEDAQYLVKAVNNMFPELNLAMKDIESSWAGLRPLIHQQGKSPSELSRKDEIFVSESGLISIAGGKLTGYRKMAERIIDLVIKKLEKSGTYSFKACLTETMKINGSGNLTGDSVNDYMEEIAGKLKIFGLGKKEAFYLVRHYGIQTDEILSNFNSFPSENPLIQLARTELNFCLNKEAVLYLDDFIIRRTGRLFFDLSSISIILPALLHDFGVYFNLDAKALKAEQEKVEKAIEFSTGFKG